MEATEGKYEEVVVTEGTVDQTPAREGQPANAPAGTKTARSGKHGKGPYPLMTSPEGHLRLRI